MSLLEKTSERKPLTKYIRDAKLIFHGELEKRSWIRSCSPGERNSLTLLQKGVIIHHLIYFLIYPSNISIIIFLCSIFLFAFYFRIKSRWTILTFSAFRGMASTCFSEPISHPFACWDLFTLLRVHIQRPMHLLFAVPGILYPQLHLWLVSFGHLVCSQLPVLWRALL